MLNLSNSAAQTLLPGQSITFDLTGLRSGGCESHRAGSGLVRLRARGIYEIAFSANIGATAPGAATLAIRLDGETVPGAVMTSTTTAAGNLDNVAKPGVFVRQCECGSGSVSVVNTGTTTVTVGANSALLSVRRVA